MLPLASLLQAPPPLQTRSSAYCCWPLYPASKCCSCSSSRPASPPCAPALHQLRRLQNSPTPRQVCASNGVLSDGTFALSSWIAVVHLMNESSLKCKFCTYNRCIWLWTSMCQTGQFVLLNQALLLCIHMYIHNIHGSNKC